MTSNLDPVVNPPLRRKRRWRRVLVGLVVAVVALVAAVPWVLNLGPVRSMVVGRINSAIAPGSVVVEGWSLGWIAPVRIDGIALVDPKGKQVIAAREVRFDYGMLELILARPYLGTITVERAKIDIERRVDGTIDLLDALASTGKPTPTPSNQQGNPEPNPAASSKLAVKVVIKDGTLRVVSPELAEPLVAGQINATVAIAPDKPTTVAATLLDGERSLQLDATVEQTAPGTSKVEPADMAIQVVGKDWPLNFRGDGGLGRGRFGGNLDARRAKGLWSISSVAALDGFEAEGPIFQGDHPRFDRVTLVADLGQTAEGGGALIRKFELACPIGQLHAEGVVPPTEGASTKLRGQVDLVGLTRMLPHTLRIREGLSVDKGTATLTANLTGSATSARAELVASVLDLAATRGGQAVVIHEAPRIEAIAVKTGVKVAVERLEVKASGVDVTASGDLDSGVNLKGTVDLDALDSQIRELVDLGAVRLAGHARLAADYRKIGPGYKARVAAECRDLDLAGWTEAPIHRALARLDASATGPRLEDGRPTGWTSAKLDLKAGDLQVDLAGTREPDGTTRLGALAAGDLPGPNLGRGETKVAVRWKDQGVDVDEFRAWLMPSGSKTGEQADPSTLALAVRGRVDLEAGAVAFEAIPDVATGAVALGPGGLKVSGWKASDATIRVETGLIGDLAALDRWLAARSGEPAKGWTGPWSLKLLGARSPAGQAEFDARFAADDLLNQGPVALATLGTYRPDGDKLELASANLNSKYAGISSKATLGELTTRRVLDWSGTIDPRWEVLGPILAHSVEPGARIEAKARPFHLEGALQGESLDAILPAISGEFGLDVASLSAFGVRAGPLPIVLKLGDGRAKFDPIATTINGGPALLQADLALDAEDGLWLRVGESRINDAAINDAVSSSVLAFIAPVLSRATEVNGKVTVVLAPGGAAFPIAAKGTTRVQGIIDFHDVIFRPGPLADQVFSITGKPAPKLAFAEPVQFSILDGRVQQSGLSVPLGGGNKVEFAGSVGFDKTLAVQATVPITSAMIGRDAELEKLLNGLKVNVPIGGTLSKPMIDRRGLQAATRDAIRTVAGRGLQNEASRLVERVAGAKLPEAQAGAAAGAGTGAAGPKRDMIRGLLEGLGRDVLEPEKKP